MRFERALRAIMGSQPKMPLRVTFKRIKLFILFLFSFVHSFLDIRCPFAGSLHVLLDNVRGGVQQWPVVI